MSSRMRIITSTGNCSDNKRRLKEVLNEAEAVLIGAGAGMSVSAGYTYDGERFDQYFSDFAKKYGIRDIYSGGFYPFDTLEEYWAWWSRHIYYNRYAEALKPVYENLLRLIKDKDYFVLTTNVDHCFQKAGFDKSRLFYAQGDYGLWQCSKPCHLETYDNEMSVKQMLEQQKDMKIPSSLVPYCPRCGRPMTMNLRSDDTFVEDAGWHEAVKRYEDFVKNHAEKKILLLEVGVGGNTPVIIKYPFWRMTLHNPNAVYACINLNESYALEQMKEQSILIADDIGMTIEELLN